MAAARRQIATPIRPLALLKSSLFGQQLSKHDVSLAEHCFFDRPIMSLSTSHQGRGVLPQPGQLCQERPRLEGATCHNKRIPEACIAPPGPTVPQNGTVLVEFALIHGLAAIGASTSSIG